MFGGDAEDFGLALKLGRGCIKNFGRIWSLGEFKLVRNGA